MTRLPLLLTLTLTACTPDWTQTFSDPGTSDWTENWFLEGAKASIQNTPDGMIFNAGPIPGEHASHAVLWTKQSFEGDIKIGYEYTRLDTMMDVTSVNILYIQATGLGTEESPEDIFLSTASREEPYMYAYYLNMNALHISYATTGPNRAFYVSSRRYPASSRQDFGQGTQIQPIYEDIELFKPGETYQITVIKKGNQLTFTAERNGEKHVFEWDTSAFPQVTKGRIGFRHMWARSSKYRNIKIYAKS